MNVWSKHILDNRNKPFKDYRGEVYFYPVEHVKFADGAELSVQASRFHYCLPKYDNPGPDGWTHFEVWMFHKGMLDEDLEDMGVANREEPNTVSAEALDRVAERHGGIK